MPPAPPLLSRQQRSLRLKRTLLGWALSTTVHFARSESVPVSAGRDHIFSLSVGLGEMNAPKWCDMDLAGRVVHLRPEISKNKHGRVLPLSGGLFEIMDRAHSKRRPDCPFLFHRTYSEIFAKLCKTAGLHPVLVHDLWRTAVCSMVRAGIADRVAMVLIGHKTRSVFDRYNVVNEADLAEATKRLYVHLENQRAAGNVYLRAVGGSWTRDSWLVRSILTIQ